MSNAEIVDVRPYLTFTLEEELFALEVAKVREVLDYTNITKVPRTPEYMRGVINLRGRVVPVIDLRLKFGMTKTEKRKNTCIIVLEVCTDDEIVVLGALADSVQEVFELEPDSIEPAPRIGVKLNTEFIKGMGKNNEKFIIILDIDKVFTTVDFELIQDAGSCKMENN